MTHLIICLIVGQIFNSAAARRNAPQLQWIVIGIACYYGTYLLCRSFIVPAMYQAGLRIATGAPYTIILIATSLILGFLSCFIAFKILSSKSSTTGKSAPDVIDDGRPGKSN